VPAFPFSQSHSFLNSISASVPIYKPDGIFGANLRDRTADLQVAFIMRSAIMRSEGSLCHRDKKSMSDFRDSQRSIEAGRNRVNRVFECLKDKF